MHFLTIFTTALSATLALAAPISDQSLHARTADACTLSGVNTITLGNKLFDVLCDTDFPNADMARIRKVVTLEDCSVKCAALERCVAAVWKEEQQVCFLKNGFTEKMEVEGTHTAVLRLDT